MNKDTRLGMDPNRDPMRARQLGVDDQPVKHFFVAQVFCRWDKTTTDAGIPLAAKMNNGSVGHMPVFETREEAQAAYPQAQILTIQEAPTHD